MTKNELQERLIDFAVLTIEISKYIKKDATGSVLIGQVVRSGTSPALNYGEAIGAESSKDFVHKMQIVLKELRETYVAFKIIKKARLINDFSILEKALEECNQLISIFVKSVETNKKKLV